MKRNIVLIGFSGTGKTAVGRALARRLNWPFVDTDEEIEALAGKDIASIFADDGESRFRELERSALGIAASRRGVVIATGGGAVAQPGNYEVLSQGGTLVCLEAQFDTILGRVQQDAQAGVARPMVEGDDPMVRIQALKAGRQTSYARADWTIHTDYLTIDEITDEVLRAWARYSGRIQRQDEAAHRPRVTVTSGPAAMVTTPNANYPVFVEAGGLSSLGLRMRQAGLNGTAYIMSDEHVRPLYGPRVEASLRDTGFQVESLVLPAGEATKTLETVRRIYNWLVERRAERGHTLVALGGGVIGDMVGFAAATYVRGMPVVQVPTSLLAMVDASIGGKTGVDLPQGKNLVGAFYQPRLVLADTETLCSLPRRELIEGWAEAIKHALIYDLDLLATFEAEADRLAALDPEITEAVVRRSVAIKAEVVSQDERETGLRAILNYGHTIGHALEAVTGYERLLHGEAVAIGMMAAARISQEMGLLTAEDVARQRTLLERFGLPTCVSGVDRDALLEAVQVDKKVRAKTVRWVLLCGLGRAEVRDDVPPELVRQVVAELLA